MLTEQLRTVNEGAELRAVISIDQSARKPDAALQIRAAERSFREKPFEDIREQDLPMGLRTLRRELMDMHRNMSWMRSRLQLIPDGPGLTAHATAIVELRRKMNAGWARIEAWRATGIELKLPKEEPTTDRGALVLEQNRLRVARTRAKSKPDNTVEVDRINARLEEIKRILDGAAVPV